MQIVKKPMKRSLSALIMQIKITMIWVLWFICCLGCLYNTYQSTWDQVLIQLPEKCVLREERITAQVLGSAIHTGDLLQVSGLDQGYLRPLQVFGAVKQQREGFFSFSLSLSFLTLSFPQPLLSLSLLLPFK